VRTKRQIHLETSKHTEQVLLEFYHGIKAHLPSATLDQVVSGLVQIALKDHTAEQVQLNLDPLKPIGQAIVDANERARE
jgi:hypothetical protein